MKQDFLCVDDYGQGAVWFLVAADSPEVIRRKLPFLEIVLTRPIWMTDADYADIRKRSYVEVDNLPTEGALGLALRMSLAAHRGDPPPVSNEDASKLINQDLRKLRSRKD